MSQPACDRPCSFSLALALNSDPLPSPTLPGLLLCVLSSLEKDLSQGLLSLPTVLFPDSLSKDAGRARELIDASQRGWRPKTQSKTEPDREWMEEARGLRESSLPSMSLPYSHRYRPALLTPDVGLTTPNNSAIAAGCPPFNSVLTQSTWSECQGPPGEGLRLLPASEAVARVGPQATQDFLNTLAAHQRFLCPLPEI